MSVIWQIVAGAFSGIVAGMGMGGGTFLIPVLIIFFGVNQHIAQGLNLVAFGFCAVISLIVHIKRKMVAFKISIPIIIVGCILSVVGALLSNKIQSKNLQVLFGIFLLIIGVYQLACVIATIVKNKKNKKINLKNFDKHYIVKLYTKINK